MFMKKRRYAKLMAELHDPRMVGAPPTPPQSDLESDSDGDVTAKYEEGEERPEKYARTVIKPDEESDSILAKLLVDFHNSTPTPVKPLLSVTPPPSPPTTDAALGTCLVEISNIVKSEPRAPVRVQ
eukprot:TRINITY_DN26803_c0_g1_i1.p1 TRINITY_DN26803_c0_g1~~TRINITY_DN26803_c0_g1_i1.p1  ORF type:complete len:126 (-),score=38.39 TRINITY_DN26803_c0_g1_i1:2-379(-)